MRSVDFALPGGWHATIFHPWGTLAIALIVLVACGLLLKGSWALARHRR
ncbi:MAG: hypothetical protein ACRD1V_03250 [Vicinamibacterales bacterium]